MKKLLILTVVVSAIGLFAYAINRPKNSPSPSTMVHSFTITDEKTFLENMIPHHQEAVDTSATVLAQTQDAELKAFTQRVIDAQSKEIAQMKSWLLSWYSTEYTLNSHYEPMMATNLAQLKDSEQESTYIQGMILHHKGAIEMAKKVLTLNPREEVKRLAEAIIATQEAEIATLKQWLTTKYPNTQQGDADTHQIQTH